MKSKVKSKLKSRTTGKKTAALAAASGSTNPINLIIGATLQLANGGGITLQDLAFSADETKATRADILASYRDYCKYMEKVLLTQLERMPK